MRCTIFANGHFSPPSHLDRQQLQKEMIIATDGGAVHCHLIGIIPDLLVGDMDSIPGWLLAQLEQQGVEILRFSPRKDKTDLELAIEQAIERGADTIVLLAALGLRWDMSIGTVMLLASPHLAGLSLTLRDEATDIFCIRSEQQITVSGRPGDRLSLIPLGGSACGVSLSGLAYPLTNHDMPMGSTLGISNVFIRPQARIELRQGLLLCIFERMDKTD